MATNAVNAFLSDHQDVMADPKPLLAHHGIVFAGALGQGSFGAVVRIEGNINQCAKLLRYGIAWRSRALALAEARQELQILERARNHQNVINIMKQGLFEWNACIGMFLPLRSGGTLSAALKNHGGRLPTPMARQIVIGIINGLYYLSEKNIVHRDLKLENVILPRRTEPQIIPVIIDLGLAYCSDVHHEEERLMAKGTPLMFSIEMARNLLYAVGADGRPPCPITTAHDVWCVGLISLQLLGGKLPFTMEGCEAPNCEWKANIRAQQAAQQEPARSAVESGSPEDDDDSFPSSAFIEGGEWEGTGQQHKHATQASGSGGARMERGIETMNREYRRTYVSSSSSGSFSGGGDIGGSSSLMAQLALAIDENRNVSVYEGERLRSGQHILECQCVVNLCFNILGGLRGEYLTSPEVTNLPDVYLDFLGALLNHDPDRRMTIKQLEEKRHGWLHSRTQTTKSVSTTQLIGPKFLQHHESYIEGGVNKTLFLFKFGNNVSPVSRANGLFIRKIMCHSLPTPSGRDVLKALRVYFGFYKNYTVGQLKGVHREDNNIPVEDNLQPVTFRNVFINDVTHR